MASDARLGSTHSACQMWGMERRPCSRRLREEEFPVAGQVRPEVPVHIRPELSRRCPVPPECPVSSSGGAVGESAGESREPCLPSTPCLKARHRASSPAALPTVPCPSPAAPPTKPMPLPLPRKLFPLPCSSAREEDAGGSAASRGKTSVGSRGTGGRSGAGTPSTCLAARGRTRGRVARLGRGLGDWESLTLGL
jgi:hypothetical protein